MKQVINFNNKNWELPTPTYIVKDYIRMTATNKGGIITDYCFNPNTSKVELLTIDYSTVPTDGNWYNFFGTTVGPLHWDDGTRLNLSTHYSYISVGVTGTGWDNPSFSKSSSTEIRYTINFSNSIQTYIVSTGTTETHTLGLQDWTNNIIPLGICCSWGPSTYTDTYNYTDPVSGLKAVDYCSTIKVKYCKVWEIQNGEEVLVRHFVPCLYTNKACMVDIVNNTIVYSTEPSYTEVGKIKKD